MDLAFGQHFVAPNTWGDLGTSSDSPAYLCEDLTRQ